MSRDSGRILAREYGRHVWGFVERDLCENREYKTTKQIWRENIYGKK